MAGNEEQSLQSLAPPSVTALRQDFAGGRAPIERTASMDIREEREDLKEAAEQSLNVVLDLGLDGIIRWVSPSWKDLVGTTPESMKGKPIAEILLSRKEAFADAVESMKKDDSRSQFIRFRVETGPYSVLKKDTEEKEADQDPSLPDAERVEKEQILSVEGQGIMVYDRVSGGESHVSRNPNIGLHLLTARQTMWMLRPSSAPKEITIDLPEVLVESLGVGAEMLAHYLTSLAEVAANDPENHPPPLPVLCRICERQITPWWFEKHSELCLQEYRAEMEVQLAQEALTEHRNAIVKVLDALEARKTRPPVSGEIPNQAEPPPEYKGMLIGPPSQTSSGSDSGRASPSTPPRSRDVSSSGLGHSHTKSFAVRRPLQRIVELILDLCDTAMEINIPAIKSTQPSEDGAFRTQSPGSESRIAQVKSWQTPGANSLEQEQGLAMLSADTEGLAQAKVETVERHRDTIEYSERIRVEYDTLVIECIDAAMKKAASIAAGQLSDSTQGDEEDEQETPAAHATSFFNNDSYDESSVISASLRTASDPALSAHLEERRASLAYSAGSNSPIDCRTPRSHTHSLSMASRSQSVSKRASLYMCSDPGDSDTNMSSINIGAPRTESPASERALGRSSSSGTQKRRSLRLPNIPSPHRQPSPGRANGPSSPLRSNKPRLSMALEGFPSPITSPPLSGTEHSSPIIQSHRHRRQSSAASSTIDPHRAPPSPRLAALAHPQAKAVPTSIKDFEIIKPISKGAFGSVYLSKKKSTGDYFAIKVLKKADMVAKNQISNVKAERAIMMWQGESDFVAKLYWTFSSKDFLYLVMEYLNGGDCASLVKILGGLSEDWAKKYLAEVILGVEHLHSRGIVHRDLKPDNLLIDQKGHLKLTDFGLSRMGLIGRQKRYLKSPNESTPDLLKQGPFARNTSMTSSRSASFDMQGSQGNHSPGSTPIMTPDLAASLGQPSYFNLNRDYKLGREHSRRKSGYRSDSGNSDSFNIMFRNFSLNDEGSHRGAPIEEETHDEGGGSPDPYALQPTTSNMSQNQHHTPPLSGMLPPPMALFDPEDHNRRFVGTPDYLAPETINGLGQDEMSDWWSLGCIMFEFLYGYPPFHADTPEKVFENILARKIDWPDEAECPVSDDAHDIMERLMTIKPKERLGANMEEQHSSGGEEIRQHPWFKEINWETLLQDEAQFVPAPQNPEDTEYFDDRGATLQAFAEEMEDQASSPAATPGADYPDRPHDALSRVRNQVNSMKRGLMPLHIPAHVRDGRSRRLSEPVQTDDFGNFTYKNLPVLEKANKDVLQKLRSQAHMSAKSPGAVQSPATGSPGPTLEKSPLLPMPLKRAMSQNRAGHRPSSPSGANAVNASPNRASNPSSPLLVSFSTGQNHERRKTSSTSSTLSHQSGQSLQPGSFFEVPRLPNSQSTPANTLSPVKTNRLSMNMLVASPERTPLAPRPQSIATTSRARSQTVGSGDGNNSLPPPPTALGHYKRRSQVFDVSPSSSDNEDPRTKALLRVQRRRQSSRRMSRVTTGEGPSFRPLDVLICEDHPVSRHVMERLLEKLRCRTITVVNGPEAVRYAMSEVQFDIIMMEYKLPQINGADVARMIRDTKSANTQTPIIAVTGYLKELPQTHHFDSLIEKPPTLSKLTDALRNLCQWKPPPPGYTPQPIQNPPSALRQESKTVEDSPSSQSSGPFARLIGSRPSREHSIGSSFFGDTDSTNTEDIPAIMREPSNEWQNQGLGIHAPDVKPFIHPGLPHLLHQNSAPPAFDQRTPRRQRSAEAVKAKRADLEKHRHECAESGDDEDEELGDVQVRARSPQNRSRAGGGSKLSVEMMRANSRGSVTSVPDEPEQIGQTLPTVPSTMELDTITMTASSAIQPPEIFPKDSAGDKQRIIDMDATPRATNVSAPSREQSAPRSQDDMAERSFLSSPSPTRESH